VNTTSNLVQLSTGREQRRRAGRLALLWGLYARKGDPHGCPLKRRQADCLKESTIVPFILPGVAMDIELETHMGQCEDSSRCTSCQWPLTREMLSGIRKFQIPKSDSGFPLVFTGFRFLDT
jgi:hypothetical protein